MAVPAAHGGVLVTLTVAADETYSHHFGGAVTTERAIMQLRLGHFWVSVDAEF